MAIKDDWREAENYLSVFFCRYFKYHNIVLVWLSALFMVALIIAFAILISLVTAGIYTNKCIAIMILLPIPFVLSVLISLAAIQAEGIYEIQCAQVNKWTCAEILLALGEEE